MARKEQRAAYLFLLPWLIGLAAFWVIPSSPPLCRARGKWNIITDPEWLGLQNHKEMLSRTGRSGSRWSDPQVHGDLRPVVPDMRAAPVILLNLKIQASTCSGRSCSSSTLSGVAVAVLWVALLNPDVGAVNTLLRAIGLDDPPRWLQSPTWAVPSVALVGLWGIGAARSSTWRGCKNISAQLYEAALDGAGPLQRFRYVTLPMITPTLLFVLLTGLIDAFQVFDLAYVLSRGGQGSGIAQLLPDQPVGFVNGRYGYASALAWVLILIAAATILLVFRTSGRWVYYEYDPDRER